MLDKVFKLFRHYLGKHRSFSKEVKSLLYDFEWQLMMNCFNANNTFDSGTKEIYRSLLEKGLSREQIFSMEDVYFRHGQEKARDLLR